MNLKDMEAINMNEEINNVIAKIISKVNPEWNKLQIIRFVYLELGKYLEKNTDFFLSDKLDSLSLSVEEINNIYFVLWHHSSYQNSVPVGVTYECLPSMEI